MNENLNTNEQNANGQDTFNGQQPPQPPTSDGTQPTFDGTQMPTSDGTQPTFDGSQMPMMPPPMMGGGMHQPPMMHGGNMWGNAGFAGEEMLNGNNFAPGNIGEQNDLSGIVDNGAGISVNIGEQNNFANFMQGGMPPMFGGQGGQFNQPPQQAAQTTQAE